MKETRVRLGFVGLYFSNFQAKEHRIYEKSVNLLESIASQWGFDLVCQPGVVESPDEVRQACVSLKNDGIDFLLLQASSLMLGDTITMFGDVCRRIGFWCVPEPTLKGELPLNSLTGFNLGVSILRKKFPDRPLKWFYGSPDGDDRFLERLRITLRAIRALKGLEASRIGIMHDVVPTFLNLTYDPGVLESRLGINVVSIPLADLFERVRGGGAVTEAAGEIEKEMRSAAVEVRVPDSELRLAAGISESMLEIANELDVDALAVRCWPEFQEVLHTAPCAAIAYLNDNGLVASCEGDLPGAISMLVAGYISGEAPTMNDPVALDMEADLIQMWHCGPGPASWADESGQVLDWHHTLNRRLDDGVAKYGVSSDIAFKPGAVTLLHIAGDAGTVFVVQAEVVDGPSKPFPGSGGWLGNLTSEGRHLSGSDFLENIVTYGLEHHYPVMRGHHEASVREFASWSGMEVLEVKQAREYVGHEPGPPGGIRSDEA